MTPLLEMLLKLFCHHMKNVPSMDGLKQVHQELEKTVIAIEALDKLLKDNSKRLNKQSYVNHLGGHMPDTFRVYSEEEYDKLSMESLGLLHELEKTGILTSKDRELVLIQISLREQSRFELDDFKHVLHSTFKDKFTLVEHWWLQAWPFNELENVRVH